MRSALVFIAFFLVAGCDTSSPFEPEFTRGLGALYEGDPYTPTIQVPAQIQPGVPARITVVTQGSTCEKLGDTEVSFVDGAVEIRPYDLSQVLRGSEACGFLQQRIPHTVDVTFSAAGPILVRAIGEYFNGTPQERELGIVVR